MKKNLFTLASEFTFSKGSKTQIILSEGSTKHDEVELAKALLKTKAYKTNYALSSAVDAVLTVKVKEEKEVTEKVAERSSTRRAGEPSRGW